jgi:hypothetical protein
MKPLLVLSFVFLLPCSASSALAAGVRPWLSADGVWNNYAMANMTQHFDVGTVGNDIRGDLGFRGAVGVESTQGLSVGVGVERLTAFTDLAFPGGVSRLTYDLPATAVFGIVQARIHQGGVDLRLGVSGGVISVKGEHRLTVAPLAPVILEVTGTSPMAECHLSADRHLASVLAVTATVGYRLARVYRPIIQDDAGRGYAPRDVFGSRFNVDYTGPVVRLGLRFAASR